MRILRTGVVNADGKLIPSEKFCRIKQPFPENVAISKTSDEGGEPNTQFGHFFQLRGIALIFQEIAISPRNSSVGRQELIDLCGSIWDVLKSVVSVSRRELARRALLSSVVGVFFTLLVQSLSRP